MTVMFWDNIMYNVLNSESYNLGSRNRNIRDESGDWGTGGEIQPRNFSWAF